MSELDNIFLPLNGKESTLFLRIASLLLNPLAYVDVDLIQLGPLDSKQVLAMAQVPAFRKHLEVGIRKTMGCDQIFMSPNIISSIADSPVMRVAVLILIMRLDIIKKLSIELAAAALAGRLVKIIVKKERDKYLGVFGQEIFSMAVHEAPMLYKFLAAFVWQDEGDVSLLSIAGTQELAFAYGYKILIRFLLSQDKALSDIMQLRISSNHITDIDPLTSKQSVQLVNSFICKRYPSWANYIR